MLSIFALAIEEKISYISTNDDESTFLVQCTYNLKAGANPTTLYYLQRKGYKHLLRKDYVA
jgi:hypothetical protein